MKARTSPIRAKRHDFAASLHDRDVAAELAREIHDAGVAERDERAAVYMAHAYGELSGRIGVALITAGPGVTNAMTGIANAHVARGQDVVE